MLMEFHIFEESLI